MTADTDGDDAAFIEAADELYGLAPTEFTAARNAFAKAARAAGNRDLGGRIAALRRPTQVAWLINQWIRRHPDGADAIVDVGAALRDAQRRAAADQLRELSKRRRAVVKAAAIEIGQLALDLNVTLSVAAERDVVQTLRAAMADDEVAEQLRRGWLVSAAEYSGFGPAGMFAVPDAAPEAAPTAPTAEPAGAENPDKELIERRWEVREELARVEAVETRAHRAADAAAKVALDAARAVDELAAEADRLRAELDRVEHELGFARRRAEAAYDEKVSAESEVVDVQRVVIEIHKRLEALNPRQWP